MLAGAGAGPVGGLLPLDLAQRALPFGQCIQGLGAELRGAE